MPTTKVAVTIDSQLLAELDGWVAAGEYPSRSRAIQAAVTRLRGERARRTSLLRELTKLDPAEERGLAEERLSAEPPWPEY